MCTRMCLLDCTIINPSPDQNYIAISATTLRDGMHTSSLGLIHNMSLPYEVFPSGERIEGAGTCREIVLHSQNSFVVLGGWASAFFVFLSDKAPLRKTPELQFTSKSVHSTSLRGCGLEGYNSNIAPRMAINARHYARSVFAYYGVHSMICSIKDLNSSVLPVILGGSGKQELLHHSNWVSPQRDVIIPKRIILCDLMLGRPTPPVVEGQKSFNFTVQAEDYLAILF
ncbi:hypothetical protein BDR03DRAFT_985873 [Suillus americanus]|nr:hypothetical protein BDR03DRAFT_985873 [Suillus americanus]